MSDTTPTNEGTGVLTGPARRYLVVSKLREISSRSSEEGQRDLMVLAADEIEKLEGIIGVLRSYIAEDEGAGKAVDKFVDS